MAKAMTTAEWDAYDANQKTRSGRRPRVPLLNAIASAGAPPSAAPPAAAPEMETGDQLATRVQAEEAAKMAPTSWQRTAPTTFGFGAQPAGSQPNFRQQVAQVSPGDSTGLGARMRALPLDAASTPKSAPLSTTGTLLRIARERGIPPEQQAEFVASYQNPNKRTPDAHTLASLNQAMGETGNASRAEQRLIRNKNEARKDADPRYQRWLAKMGGPISPSLATAGPDGMPSPDLMTLNPRAYETLAGNALQHQALQAQQQNQGNPLMAQVGPLLVHLTTPLEQGGAGLTAQQAMQELQPYIQAANQQGRGGGGMASIPLGAPIGRPAQAPVAPLPPGIAPEPAQSISAAAAARDTLLRDPVIQRANFAPQTNLDDVATFVHDNAARLTEGDMDKFADFVRHSQQADGEHFHTNLGVNKNITHQAMMNAAPGQRRRAVLEAKARYKRDYESQSGPYSGDRFGF